MVELSQQHPDLLNATLTQEAEGADTPALPGPAAGLEEHARYK